MFSGFGASSQQPQQQQQQQQQQPQQQQQSFGFLSGFNQTPQQQPQQQQQGQQLNLGQDQQQKQPLFGFLSNQPTTPQQPQQQTNQPLTLGQDQQQKQPLFGFLSNPQTPQQPQLGQPLSLGQDQQQKQSLFGSLLGSQTTQQQQPQLNLQQQQQQPQPTQQLTHEQEQQQKQQKEQMLQLITQPKIYNDARDKILGDFNRVQALWGTGKAYYSISAQPVDLTESQPVGFHCLSERYKLQQQETQQQRSRLQQLSEQLSELQKHVAAIKSKLEECRRKRVVLGNRVLKVLVMQEIENRKGFPIQADEEKLRSRMENILSELHCQTKYRGCLNELISQLKQIQSQQHRTPQVHLDESVVDDIKEHLKNELKAIEHLITVIKQDKKNVMQQQ